MTKKYIEDARKAILGSSITSSIYVGCDSIRFKKNGKWYARYSTVIIIHKESKHGCTLFHNTETLQDYSNLKQRLLNETMFAVTAACDILDIIGSRHMEVHLDINPDPNHKSNIAVKEACGYVIGMTGVEATLKPEAFAATHCSDHLVRHIH